MKSEFERVISPVTSTAPANTKTTELNAISLKPIMEKLKHNIQPDEAETQILIDVYGVYWKDILQIKS